MSYDLKEIKFPNKSLYSPAVVDDFGNNLYYSGDDWVDLGLLYVSAYGKELAADKFKRLWLASGQDNWTAGYAFYDYTNLNRFMSDLGLSDLQKGSVSTTLSGIKSTFTNYIVPITAAVTGLAIYTTVINPPSVRAAKIQFTRKKSKAFNYAQIGSYAALGYCVYTIATGNYYGQTGDKTIIEGVALKDTKPFYTYLQKCITDAISDPGNALVIARQAGDKYNQMYNTNYSLEYLFNTIWPEIMWYWSDYYVTASAYKNGGIEPSWYEFWKFFSI
jgi:hypothetical protein